jgi:N6-adenosine-specific RNA methylase IME4
MIRFPNKTYNVIYADPCWQYSSKSYQDGNRTMKSLNSYYETMTTKEIAKLPIQSISKDNCVCFMWVTDSHLVDGLEVMKEWGFTYKTIAFTWVKQTKNGNTCYNFSPYTLKSTELCIVGIKGRLRNIKAINNVKGLVFAERTKHSKKPSKIRDLISEWCGNKPRIELFARERVDGWDSWGNEV